MGFCENCPSGSEPVQSMRTDGVTCARRRAVGIGFRIATVGAIVNAKNARFLRADSAPWSSTALITKTCGSDAVGGSLPLTGSGFVAWKNTTCSFFVVLIHTESVFVGSMQYS